MVALRYIGNNKTPYMAKIYSKKKLATPEMLPKKETIDFLLNYSKALQIVKTSNGTYENIAN
ncbi:MAG: hypothetical protein BM557_07100 [Flavobacterium sp. MedPE-SWcel]|nr:MAG: hypothetical protein BM557_07100 [Flavobacterium sp. MedPE-SWcel]